MKKYIDTYALLFSDNNMNITDDTEITVLPEIGSNVVYFGVVQTNDPEQHVLVGKIESRSLDEQGLYVSIELHDKPLARNVINPSFWQELFKKKLVKFDCFGKRMLDNNKATIATLDGVSVDMIPCKSKKGK